MPRRIIKTVDGRRGSFLTLSGVMFLPVSVTYLFARERAPILDWAPEWVTMPLFGGVFAAAAGFAFLAGVLSKRLSPEIVGYGYLAAMFIPMIATALFIIAGLTGIVAAWPHVVLNGGWVALIYLASAWPNPPQTPPAVDDAEVP